MHQMLMAKALTMHLYANLPPYLWDKLYLRAAYLHTKTTTRSLKGETPWEKWHDPKADYSYIQEIGCKVYILIPKKNNSKIFEHLIECVLIGYDPKSKMY